jgi:RimJ/RimL family protein N-acetyltransferase
VAISDILTGRGFLLRPVEAADAALALELRGNPELTRYLPPLNIDRDAQARWIDSQRAKPDDYYWAVQRKGGDGRVEGFVGLYGRTPENGFEWGRWILRRDSLAAAESAQLMYAFAFEQLDAPFVTCQSVVDNQKVVQFHANCGLAVHRPLPGRFVIDGQALDAVEQILAQADWPAAKAYLDRAASQAARLLERRG